jgi:dienelactone hydrolase
MRRQYEDLAARFAAADSLIAVVGCWFDPSASERMPDAIDCPYGPDPKGISAASVADVDALVAAAHDVPGVDRDRLGVVGHSAGASVALVRAGLGLAPEPVVSSSGLLAPTPGSSPTDLYAIDSAGTIRVPVFVVHGAADPICPLAQVEAFVAALSAAGNPPKTLFLEPPASHAIPFQGEACADEPGVALADRFVREVVDWIATLPSPGRRR